MRGFNLNCLIFCLDPQFKCIVPKILRLVSAYTIICRYSEENRQSHNGYVNQALACYISKFIRDYLVRFILMNILLSNSYNIITILFRIYIFIN